MNIIELKSGDVSVFNEVYEDYSTELYDFIYTKTRSSFYANEVVQITFIKFWERHEELKDDVPLRAQIFQIAKTTLIDILRKVEKERLKINSFAKSEVMQETTEDELMNKCDAQRILKRTSGQMPPMRQKVFNLRIQQFSYKEIAYALSISTKTVSKHLELARKQIEPYLNSFFN